MILIVGQIQRVYQTVLCLAVQPIFRVELKQHENQEGREQLRFYFQAPKVGAFRRRQQAFIGVVEHLLRGNNCSV